MRPERKEFESMAYADFWRGYTSGSDEELLRLLLDMGPYRTAWSAFKNRKWLKTRADFREEEYNQLEAELRATYRYAGYA